MMIITTSIEAQPYNCFSIIAGKKATVDGSVLLAHNEDDSGEQMLNVYVVHRNKEQGTAKYLWTEFPGMKASDSFLNEFGVAITSDNCPSKEDAPELVNGGILYELRVEAAQKATSARDAVKIMGNMIDKFGYSGSGRTYLLADCNEGWILSVVNGKHWVAVKVPDNAILAIPNNYTIDKVDLTDTENYAGSADIISYAIKRGWYNPSTDGEFSFKKAYGSPSTYISSRNVIRHLSALEYFTGKTYTANPDTFPCYFIPKSKVSVQDMINVLSSHGENTIYKDSIANASKNHHPKCICVNSTVMAAVFQLRDNMPKEIASVMWLAPYHPCATPFIPWYIGMTSAPEGFARFNTAKEAIGKHFSNTSLRANNTEAIYWKYVDNFTAIDKDYHNNIKKAKDENNNIQTMLMKNQGQFEKKCKRIVQNKGSIAKILNDYTKLNIQQTLDKQNIEH